MFNNIFSTKQQNKNRNAAGITEDDREGRTRKKVSLSEANVPNANKSLAFSASHWKSKPLAMQS